jgi:Zn-dependent metalloprotease
MKNKFYLFLIISLLFYQNVYAAKIFKLKGFDISKTEKKINALIHNAAPNRIRSADSTNKLVPFEGNSDLSGNTHIRYVQTYYDIPIWGYQVIVHKNNGRSIERKTGALVEDIELDITRSRALVDYSGDLILNRMKVAYQNERQVNVGNLYYQNERAKKIIYIDDNEQAHIAFLVNFFVDSNEGDDPARPYYIVDAGSQEILLKWDGLTNQKVGTGPGGNIRTGQYFYGTGSYEHLDVTVDGDICSMINDSVATFEYTTVSSPIIPYSFPCYQNTYKSINGAYSPMNDAHYFATVVYEFYDDWYGIKPIPFNILPVQVHKGYRVENAYWNGSTVLFGDGANRFYPLVSLDVMGHEIGHGFTEYNSGLIYMGQSAGINESFSDMAGVAAVYYETGESVFTIGGSILKDENIDGLRSLSDPESDGRSIDHVDEYYVGLDPHFSCGVYNKAFYLLATKRNWNIKKAFDVMLNANQNHWTSQTGFMDGVCGAIYSAMDLRFDYEDVKDAFEQVGAVCEDYSWYMHNPVVHQDSLDNNQKNSGPATISMITNKLAQVSINDGVIERSQAEVSGYISTYLGTDIPQTGINSDTVLATLQHYNDQLGHFHYVRKTTSDVKSLLFSISYYQEDNKYAAAIPLFGGYRHWVVIEGISAETSPKNWDGSGQTYPLFGLYIDDPNEEVFGKRFITAYTLIHPEEGLYLPTDGNYYEGIYDPPPTELDSSIYIVIPDTNNMQSLSEDSDIAEIACQAIEAMKLKANREFFHAYKETIPGSPIYINRTDGGSDYYLIPYSKSDNRITVIIRLNADTGQFMEASYTHNDNESLRFPAQTNQNIRERRVYSWSTSFQSSPYRPLYTPENIQISSSGGGFKISWENSLAPQTTNLYRNGILYKQGLTGSDYIDTDIEPNTQYVYSLSSVAANNEESQLSTPFMTFPDSDNPCEMASQAINDNGLDHNVLLKTALKDTTCNCYLSITRTDGGSNYYMVPFLKEDGSISVVAEITENAGHLLQVLYDSHTENYYFERSQDFPESCFNASFDHTLDQGMNLFSYPVEVPPTMTSYQLIQELGTPDEVIKIQRFNGSWETTNYFMGEPSGVDFPIKNGEGLVVYMRPGVQKTVSFTGKRPNYTVNLNTGFNLVGFSNMFNKMSSGDVLGFLGQHSVSKIQTYDDQWQTIIWFNNGPAGVNFTLQPGKAYIVYMKQNLQMLPSSM